MSLLDFIKIILVIFLFFVSCIFIIPDCANCFSPYGSSWREQANKIYPEPERDSGYRTPTIVETIKGVLNDRERK